MTKSEMIERIKALEAENRELRNQVSKLTEAVVRLTPTVAPTIPNWPNPWQVEPVIIQPYWTITTQPNSNPEQQYFQLQCEAGNITH